MQIEIQSLEQTKAFAERLAELCRDKQIVITLDGDLGAGKTTWTQFFAKALGVKEVVNSPTFTIMKSYKQGNGQPLYHIDAYRLEGMSQDLGFEDCFDEGICVIEWSEFIANQLPDDRLSISIEQRDENDRIVTMEGSKEKSKEIVEAYHD